MPLRRGQDPSKSTPLKSLQARCRLFWRHRQAPCVTRLYRSPTVQDGPESPTYLGPPPRSLWDANVLGWKVSARCVVPEDLGPVRAGPRACCVKCAHTYYNFQADVLDAFRVWIKCVDCVHGHNDCVMVDPQFGDHLKVLQLAADILLESQADDDEAGLEDDSPATTQALKALAEAQRTFTNTVRAKESAT